jgi:hypothetical protein
VSAKDEMYVVGVDLGIVHLAFVRAEVEDDYSEIRIESVELVDLTQEVNCDTTLQSRLSAYLKRTNWGTFQEASLVVLERQPPMGAALAVQELLHLLLDQKGINARLISPRSVHAHYGETHLDYEQRKESATKRFYTAVGEAFKGSLAQMDRVHDVADAYQMIEYTCRKESNERERKREREATAEALEDFSSWVVQFRYQG